MSLTNILLTGKPGVGKTTIIQKIVEEHGKKAGGFYTREMRENHRRTGFEIITLDGKKGVLASVHLESPYRVGKYRVNLKDLEEIGVKAIEEALHHADLVVIDEIGKMELFSKNFRKVVKQALDSPKKFLGTIMHGSNPFVDKIKQRADVKIFEITERNRNYITGDIKKLLEWGI
ncbi:MAG: NTPase [Calditrichaeota bacterium]|nr:MAG: NTPase [Calditrichota bacterium]